MPDPGTAELLASGKAFADLSSWRKIAVSGPDAFDWLNDLVSSDISDLTPGRARRSLLLSRTGSIRADFTVSIPVGNMLLIQDPDQPSIKDLLEPYVLSSDVDLADRTAELALWAFPGRANEPEVPGAALSVPSALGAGFDLIAPGEDHQSILSRLGESYQAASVEDVEAWRIGMGIPKLGVDVVVGDLPQEAGLMDAVSLGKGCYVGQEAVAKLENLGHPRRLVVAIQSPGPVSAGDSLLAGGREVGEITSAAGSAGLARIGWADRAAPWQTPSGAEVYGRAD